MSKQLVKVPNVGLMYRTADEDTTTYEWVPLPPRRVTFRRFSTFVLGLVVLGGTILLW